MDIPEISNRHIAKGDIFCGQEVVPMFKIFNKKVYS